MEEVQKHLYILILAGGGGTRLWPLSRNDSPKQFTQLFGGRSLFQITLDRALHITPPSHIYISTAHKYLDQVRKDAKIIPDENLISEPVRRDTAIAHGLGAAYIYKHDPQAVIVNLASDHLISPLSTFVKQIKLAAKVAYQSNLLVTVGIKPRFPHTGMGHIKASRKFTVKGILIGEKFTEKPSLTVAKRFTNSGKYFWNANLYVFKAKLYLDLLKKYAPKSYALFPKILEFLGTGKEREVISLAFQMAPTISIDYAITEKISKFLCLPGEFNWVDIGDWLDAYDNLPQDQAGNVIEGPNGRGQYIGINSKNNLLFLDKQLIATVGVENMLVVDTPDAILICRRDEAQSVKQVVQALKDNNLTEYL